MLVAALSMHRKVLVPGRILADVLQTIVADHRRGSLVYPMHWRGVNLRYYYESGMP